MTSQTKRTTLYLDPNLHKALRLKSIAVSRSVSEIINEAIRQSLAEDAEDIETFESRGKELLISYEEMVKRLKKDGKI
jgi:post-segregation antitoxin (ccd killing protein)